MLRAIVLVPLLALAGCDKSTYNEVSIIEETVIIQLKPPVQNSFVEIVPFVEEKPEPVEQIALRYVGFGAKSHRTELKEFIGVDPVRTEWCAAFVNAVLNESGLPGSESVSEYPLLARSFLNWGEAVKEPEPGDLVVFPRGSEAWQGHVGFYLGTAVVNGIKYYAILGGNQNNKVSIELFRARSALGIRRFIA